MKSKSASGLFYRKVLANSARSESSISYSYDAASRLLLAVDSVTGSVSRGCDSLDRLLTEETPQGSIAYNYDAAGRRTSMRVGGQTPVSYSYDNANRVTQITQGGSVVVFVYDAASRLELTRIHDSISHNGEVVDGL